jgi:dTDP-4-amino-4,6-dideoxygalactose transaminase
MLDLARQYALLREPIRAAIERVCSSQRFILGEEVEALESEIAAFTGTADAVGCASGTDALWLALAAVGVQPGDTVITTAFSFFASTSAIGPGRGPTGVCGRIPRPSTSIRRRS